MEENDFYTDKEYIVFDYCPKCGEFYDDADFDFQICHMCGFNANKLVEKMNNKK